MILVLREETKRAIEQLQQGNPEGFNQLYANTYHYVYMRARLTMRDEQEALDLTQEVYLALYKNIGSLQNSDSFYAWLNAIIIRQGAKMANKSKNHVLLSEEHTELFETLPDNELSAEENLFQEQDAAAIKACISELSQEQKTVVIAYYYDEMKIEEIAAALEVSPGTVKSRLYLARKNLKDSILKLEKKQGYRLHVLTIPTLVLALKMLLGENRMAGETMRITYREICDSLRISTSALHIQFCVSCGCPIPQGSNFCGNCGARVIFRESPISRDQTASPDNVAQKELGSSDIHPLEEPVSANDVWEKGSAGGAISVRTEGVTAACSTAKHFSKVWLSLGVAGVCTAGTILGGLQVIRAKNADGIMEKKEAAQEGILEPEGSLSEAEAETEEDAIVAKEEGMSASAQGTLEQEEIFAIYSPILQEYRRAQEEGFSGDYLWVSYFFQNDLTQTYRGQPIYYTFYDFCEDGIPEMLISCEENGEYIIEDAYGSDGIAPRKLIPEYESSAGGGELVFHENDILSSLWHSGGMSAGGYDYYQLFPGKAEGQWIDSVSHDGYGVCYQKSSPYVEGREISREDYEQVTASYTPDTQAEKDYQWIPLAESATLPGIDGEGYNPAYREILRREALFPKSFQSYYVYDLDDNGIPELLITKGNTEDTIKCTVYAYDKRGNVAYYAGSFSAPQVGFYDNISAAGIVALTKLGVSYDVRGITLENGELVVEETLDDESEAIDRYRSEMPLLTSHAITDLEVLKGNTGFFQTRKEDVTIPIIGVGQFNRTEGEDSLDIGDSITFTADSVQAINALYIVPGRQESQYDFYDYSCPTKIKITCGEISEIVDVSCGSWIPGEFLMITAKDPMMITECTITIVEVREGAKYNDTYITDLQLVYE